MASYRETIDYLYSLLGLGIRPGLGTIKRLLYHLGNPQNSYPSVLVAGTNGKGSTAAFLESMLTEGGYRAGLYTSPHLARLNERIRVSGALIPDRDVARLCRTVRNASEGLFEGARGPTFFEFTTAMAFIYFKEKEVDAAVLEVGMGGRLDATNVATPLVSVITNIGLEHTDRLGTSIEKIAGEKAGIVKAGVPVVTGAEQREAAAVITGAARSLGTRVYRLGRDFRAETTGEGFNYRGIRKNLFGLRTGLRGRHQHRNAACALAALELMEERGYAVSEDSIRKGLEEVFWPGRLEVLRGKPTVILDCAHNPDGARVLAKALAELYPGKKPTLVLGCMKDKDIPGILAALLPLSEKVILTAPAIDRAAPPEFLAQKSRPFRKKTIITETVSDACRTALLETPPEDIVCVTGSIFTVGEARSLFKKAGPQKDKGL